MGHGAFVERREKYLSFYLTIGKGWRILKLQLNYFSLKKE